MIVILIDVIFNFKHGGSKFLFMKKHNAQMLSDCDKNRNLILFLRSSS